MTLPQRRELWMEALNRSSDRFKETCSHFYLFPREQLQTEQLGSNCDHLVGTERNNFALFATNLWLKSASVFQGNENMSTELHRQQWSVSARDWLEQTTSIECHTCCDGIEFVQPNNETTTINWGINKRGSISSCLTGQE